MADSKVPASQTFATQYPAERDAAEQTFTRPVNFQSAVVYTPLSIDADGDDQDSAAEVPVVPLVFVDDADGTKGVILPSGAPLGTEIKIYVEDAAELKVYPHGGGNINGGSDDAAIVIDGPSLGSFLRVSSAKWNGIFTAPSE